MVSARSVCMRSTGRPWHLPASAPLTASVHWLVSKLACPTHVSHVVRLPRRTDGCCSPSGSPEAPPPTCSATSANSGSCHAGGGSSMEPLRQEDHTTKPTPEKHSVRLMAKRWWLWEEGGAWWCGAVWCGAVRYVGVGGVWMDEVGGGGRGEERWNVGR